MKVSLQWLRELVSIGDMPVEDLARALTMGGLEVEEVMPLGGAFSGIVVGHVKKVSPHPNADKLRVTEVDAGTGETLWIYRPDEGERFVAAPRKIHRGVSYWSDGQGDDRIIFATPGFNLIALDAHTGIPVADFGDNGIVDMITALDLDFEGMARTRVRVRDHRTLQEGIACHHAVDAANHASSPLGPGTANSSSSGSPLSRTRRSAGSP